MESSEKTNNGSFVFYDSFYKSAEIFGEEKLIKAIMQIVKYGLYGVVPDNSDDQILQALMINWMPLVDAGQQKKKGGAPNGNQNAKGKGAPKGNRNAAKNKQQNKQPSDVDHDVDHDNDVDHDISPSSSSSEEESTQGRKEGWTGEDKGEVYNLDAEFAAWQARMKEQKDGTV